MLWFNSYHLFWQEFLKRKNFPAVPDDKIVRWHPEFPVDSVPNIPVGVLPEEPDLKVCTARDVLNKLKGSVRGRVRVFPINLFH